MFGSAARRLRPLAVQAAAVQRRHMARAVDFLPPSPEVAVPGPLKAVAGVLGTYLGYQVRLFAGGALGAWRFGVGCGVGRRTWT